MPPSLDTIQLNFVSERALNTAEAGQAADAIRTALDYPFKAEFVRVNEIPRGPTGKFEQFLSHLEDIDYPKRKRGAIHRDTRTRVQGGCRRPVTEHVDLPDLVLGYLLNGCTNFDSLNHRVTKLSG